MPTFYPNQIAADYLAALNALANNGSMAVRDAPNTFTSLNTFAAGITLSGSVSNLATGANFISYGGTDVGLSFDASNNATLSGALGVSTGAAVGGATPGTGGIAFPATQVAIANVNTLDDYEEYTAASAACTGAITTAAIWKLTKIGNLVTLTLPAVVGVGVAVTSFVFGTAIPAKYRPSGYSQWLCVVRDNGNPLAQPGVIQINNSTGVITVFREPTGVSAFTVTASAGLPLSTSVSWVI